jgi:hypothetical protein
MYSVGFVPTTVVVLPQIVEAVADHFTQILGYPFVNEDPSNLSWLLHKTLQLLQNRVETDPATGVMSIYDDSDQSPLYTANVYKDVAGTIPFDGTGANRRDKFSED